MTETTKGRAALVKAFAALRKAGYFARMNFMCCQTCAGALVPKEKQHKYVFFHSQDNDNLVSTDRCYLAWGGDAAEIIGILDTYGIWVQWGGTKNNRIRINIGC